MGQIHNISMFELPENELVGVFSFHKEDDIRIDIFLHLPEFLDCQGAPQPLTVPTRHF